MDMEWAKDGLTEELFILQARPETVHSQKQVETLESYRQPFLFFAADKTDPGAYNFPLYWLSPTR